MNDVELDHNWWKIWKNRRYVVVMMICTGMMNMYATRINLSVAIVAMTDTSEEKPEPEFDWTPQMKGHLLASFFYGYALMQGPAGVLLKRFPAHILYGLGVFISAILTAFIPLIAHNFYVLLMFRVIMGVFQAIAVPGTIKFLSNWAPPLERSRMSGICTSGAFIGTVLCLPISGFVGENFGWQWIFYVFTGTSLIWLMFWIVFIRSTPQSDKFISTWEVDFIVRSIGEKSEEKRFPVPWASILLSIPVWSLFCANFAFGWGFQTMLAQLPAFMKDVAGFDLAKNGLLSSLPYITMTIMSWTAGYVADLFQMKGFTVTQVRKCFVSVSMIIQCAFIVAAAYIVNPGFNIACISISVGFGAFAYAAIGVNPLDLATPFSPIIAGLSGMFGTITGIISPIVTGFIVIADPFDHDTLKFQWQIIFLIAAAVYAAGSVMYWFGGSGDEQPWVQKSTKKKSNEL